LRNGPASSSEATEPAVDRREPPPNLALPVRTVHVWRASLEDLREAARLRRLEQHLSVDERARTARFRFARDREHFVAARGLLREILALYLGVAARRLRFGYGPNGKPFLAEYGTLRFSVSHSLDTVLVAIAHEREVGVDIEYAHAGVAVEEIAETVFSAPEKHALSRLHGEAKRMAFLRFWTRKEAYIKADGRGVSLPLEDIDVSVPADRIAVLDEATSRWRVCTNWTLQTLAAGPDHAAALAAEGQDWRLVRCQWSG
jgi:4'-phosphopantetheinyl transferase